LIFVNFVPISLLVTLEMVKFLQGVIIEREVQVGVNCSGLNEELG
jgi:phospholipid-transporting ATPase